MRIASAGLLTMATPAWTYQSGEYDEDGLTDNGTGDITAAIAASRGLAAEKSIILTGYRGGLAASGLVTFGAVHTSDVAKRITAIREAASGAESAPADLTVDLVMCDLQGLAETGLPILGAGSVAFDGGTPSLLWQAGCVEGLTDSGTGDIDIDLGATAGVDAATCVMLATPRGTLAASGLVAVGIAQHADDLLKTATILKEAATGAASVAADHAFDFVIVGLRRQPSRIKLVAMCSIVAAEPGLLLSSGFESVAAAATGTFDLTLPSSRGFDASKCAIIASPRGAAAASGLRSLAISHTSDTVKRVTALQEGGSGAVSALADFDFDLAIFAEAS